MCILLVLGYLLVVAVFLHFNNGYVFSLNYYVGFVAWIVVVCYKVFYKDIKYGVLVLLLLSFFNIIVFTVSISSFTVGFLGSNIVSPGIDPLISTILIIYCNVNRDLVTGFYRKFFKASEQELKEKEEREIEFYYKKFITRSIDELADINRDFKQYPLEAQIALKKIYKEKGFNFNI